MHLNGKRIIRVTLALLAQWVLCLSVKAQNPTLTQPLLGSLNGVNINAVSTVSDQKYFALKNAGQLSLIEQTHVIKNMVAVGIEEESNVAIQTDFTATVVLHIKKYGADELVFEEFDKTFVVDYKKAGGAKHNALQYLPFENAYKVDVQVMSITPGSGVTWDISKVLKVDNTLTPVRDFVFNCSTLIGGLATTFNAATKELVASWSDPVCGQTEYDLEWSWIDESALADYKDEVGAFLPDKIFDNNATRVTVESNTYSIPMLYDGEGKLFVRVRPAQIKYNGQRVEGTWVCKNPATAAAPVYYTFDGHESSLNWQASTSFAEGGKRKSVIQYFDGTLRNRQTVTKDNTTNTTVVAETFYDYQGRPVIQVLPAPTLSTIIQYSKNFNRAINFDGYPKMAYDKLDVNASICGNPAQPLSTVSGTAKYYSPSNEGVTEPLPAYNINNYIPNSEGPVSGQAYPFTETRFTADGRVAAQSGVGYTHQLGSSHETKYLYEPPAQEELDALFGTDAGVASHYFKNLVKDANGQYSVSYTDMHGRTIATALAGDAPNQLNPLISVNTKNFTRQLIDEETNRVLGKSIISTKALVVPKSGLYKFWYQLNPEQLSLLNCTEQPVCYDCLYHLKITITSDCNNSPGFTSPYIIVDSNFTIGQSLAEPVCNENGKTTGFFNKYFEIILPEGTYTVTKNLSLSDSAQRIYREVFIKNDTCKTFLDFYNKEYQVLLAKSNCAITCTSCMESIGNTFAIFRQNFVLQSGMTEPLDEGIVQQLQAAYNDALANCTRICNNENNIDDGMDAIRGIRQLMLQDVTPSYGQYAKLEDLNKPFNILHNDIYKQPAYKNEYGVTLNPNPALLLSPSEFSDQFQTSWAEGLLSYHPEYPKLQTIQQNLPAAYLFEANLNKVNTWQAAATAGYINNIVNLDPFFNGSVVGGNSYITVINNKINSYVNVSASSTTCTSLPAPISPSMWQLAQSAVFCRNIPVDLPCSTNVSACLQSYLSSPALVPASGCSTDWDMVWKNFRSLYLTERKKLIAQYVKDRSTPDKDQDIKDYNASIPAAEAEKKLKFRFINFNENNGTGDLDVGDLQDFFTDLAAGNEAAKTKAHDLAEAQYDSTCRGYTDMWLAQLEQCPAIAARWEASTTVKSADSIWLTDRLVRICKYGSDEYHYLGSSSINPGKIAEFIAAGGSSSAKEFPDVIAQYLNTFVIPAIPVDEQCHPYLITSPKPYDKQPSVTNQLIITRPTDCECARLTALKNEFLSHGAGFSNFSAYLKSRYGTIITQGALDTLAMLCNGTYTCIFLPAPIVLPPLLQCHGSNGETVKPCIDCKDFQVIKNDFFALFNQQAPIKEPVTETDFAVNKAFEKFANYKTGFSKNIAEYISFLDSCGENSPAVSVNPSCDSLKNILDSFYINYYNKPAYPIAYNAAGCDTTAWRFFRSPYVPFQNLFNNGIVSAPGGGFHFDYSHSICVPDSFVITYRIKPLSIPNINGQLYLPISLQTSAGARVFYIWLWNGGGKTQDNCDACGNPGIITSTSMSLIFNTWMDIAVKFRNSDGHVTVYINGNMVQDRATINTNILRINGISIQTFGNMEMQLDNVKVEKPNSETAYNETFDSACHKFAVINPKYDCSKLPCQQAFVNYFNSKKGTSYTFTQIDALYVATCGIHPAPCTPPGECNPLDQLISNFQKIYIKPASGYVDYDLRTFAGNKTPDAGPKGVFDINKNLIGNTIDGTATQIKQSYAQVWNSSQVNQTIGTLSALANGRFRLTLNQGQQAPCDGIIGMRYYQFDGAVDTLDAAVVGPGCYIDFGDGNKESIVKGLDARGTKAFYNISLTGNGYTTDASDSSSIAIYTVHTYADASLKTITVYHPDIQGVFNFDNWYIVQPLDLSKLKNLRGYMPQQTLSFVFHSTQDSSFNSTSSISNFNLINSIKQIDFADGSSTGGNSVTQINNTKFPAFSNNHNLNVVGAVSYNPIPTIQNNVQPFTTWLPDLKNNFSQLKFLRLTSYFGEYIPTAVNFSLPNLRAFAIQGFLNAEQVDSIVIQVARSSRDSGVIELYDYDGVATTRTAASDAAYNSLAGRHWSLRGGGMNLNNTPPVNVNLPLRDSFPLTNNFTEFYNQQYGTNYSYNQLMALLKAQYGYTPDYCTLLTKTCGGDTLTSGPVLCGLNKPLYDTVHYEEDPCKDISKFALTAAEEKWQLYIDSLHNVFDTAYYNKCMGAKDLESFTVNYDVSEYHYTLYYYDQAGNLVKTVPPAGVDDKHGDPVFLAEVKAARLRVKNNTGNEADPNNKVTPVHTLETNYRYNTLNQVIAQKTPDAGVSEFWYDRLGRLVVSQNAKQKATNRYSYTLYDGLGRITEVGQKPQTAVITQAITQSESQLTSWLSGNGASTNVVNKEQITRTRYDLSYDEGSNILGGSPSVLVQRNLRNRVSYTMVYDQEPNPNSTLPTHTAATFYTYDIHGNVDTLLQDLKAAMNAVSPGNNRYKKLAYEYDLISGKVNKVSYQPGMIDEFYHQYNYDAENRLTEVYTSHDNLIWEKDARYSYYRHGPLARTILGQQQVQGIDYAYTLQGWLKGVNSTGVQQDNGIIGNGADCGPNSAVDNLQVNARLSPYAPQYVARNSITFNPGFSSNATDDFATYLNSSLASCATEGIAGTEIPVPLGGNKFDIGRDGIPSVAGIASQVPYDVYGFNLNYFSGDYKPASAYERPFAPVTAPLPGSNTSLSLYNGNISSMAVNIPKLGEAHLYGYRYDQLNRIVAMDAFTGLDAASNFWTPAATQNYKERVSYDANGNILTYSRNGNLGTAMDVLSYQYPKYANTPANVDAHLVGKMINNRLRYVLDEATSTYSEDIKSNAPAGITTHQNVVDEILPEQAGDNYAYDQIGNLIKDSKEGITNISWNVYGKIQSITKATGTITYTYDASGNRISKTAAGKTTIYVRDATGNVMSVYTADPVVSNGNLIQSEADLYGSSRLGIFEVNRNVQNLVASVYLNNINTFTRGNKFFELSNHLGNVLVTISDRKVGVDRGTYQYSLSCPSCPPPPPGEPSSCPPCTQELVLTSSTPDGIIDYYTADVITANDYYPGGMDMPGRQYSSTTGYRYGFNGKEKDNKDGVVQYDYGFRIYDPRLVRFKSVDPLTYSYPYYTPYQFAGNMPIAAIDLDGLEQYVVIYFKDQKGAPYKMEIRTINANKILVDQNVQAIKKGTTETDGDKIALGNVLVFEVYNEGTKKESIKLVDSRNVEGSSLTKEEKEVLKSNNKLESKEDTRFSYPFTDNSQYESQDFEPAKFYIATKLYNQPPPKFKIEAKFVYNSPKLEDEKKVLKEMSGVIKYLKENSKKELVIAGNNGNGGTSDTEVTFDGKTTTLKDVRLQRANAIRDLLIKNGVNPAQVKAIEGGSIPVKDGSSVPTSFEIKNKK